MTARTIAELVLCVLAGWQLLRLRRCVTGTTLTAAWRWAWCPVLVAATVAIVRMDAAALGQSFAIGDYVFAVAGLTPLMAVLGARRPTCRVWTPFIVLPLLIVLNWPVLAVVLARGWYGDLAVEDPVVVGFVLVAVMACGNYFGTRLTLPAVAWGVVSCGLICCHAERTPTWWPSASTMRLVCGLVGVTGLVHVSAAWSDVGLAADRFDRLWFDMLDRFGVVWARRLQDRINALGEQQHWSGRLELDGWRWESPPSLEQQQQIEHACRWLLRRFVDPGWIDARLGTTSATPEPLKVDS